MFEAHHLNDSQLEGIEALYEAFRLVAIEDYGFPQSPITFGELKFAKRSGFIDLYGLYEYPEDRYVGFMLFNKETYGALEIKAIYLHPDVPVKLALDCLLNRFLEDAKGWDGWDVVSFALLGTRQYEYIHTITWPGFTPVGQAVVRFKLDDVITQAIVEQIKLPPLPEGYRLIPWDARYEDGVVDVLTEAFAKSVDALWDPRFRTRDGIKESLAFVQSGAYGVFFPQASSILLNPQNVPVGVCLINVVSNQEANIPLIGLLKSERGKKLGRPLLHHTVMTCLKACQAGHLKLTNISATVATGNLPAIRMYRLLGFQEDHWYPHVFQEREHVMKRRVGQWC